MGLLPDPGSSSLARDGVVMFALLQRALNEGVAARWARRGRLMRRRVRWGRIRRSGRPRTPGRRR